MKRNLVFLAIMLAPGVAHAASTLPAPSAMSDAEVRRLLASGEEIEARVDGDLNGDGDIDTALVLVSDDDRAVRVFFTARNGARVDRVAAGKFNPLPGALGPAELSIDKGILVIRDLTGGTSATSATYRFRGESTAPKMRLIGLDATAYSRTYSHDGAEMSWNLLTGDILTSQLKVSPDDNDPGYNKLGTKRARRPASILYMEDTPDPEDELSLIMQGQ